MTEGWIKIHRSIMDHWIFKNNRYFKAWIWFLFRANYEEKKVLVGSALEVVQRGEFITSIQNISKQTGMSMQSVRTFLERLEDDKMIVRKSTNKLTRITICNYDKYQDQQQTNNTQTTYEQQTNNKQTTTEKEYKERKEIKKKKEERIIPTLEEVKKYFNEKGYTEDAAIKAFNYYDVGDWHDSKNKPVKNWKQKMISVWFKPENKKPDIPVFNCKPLDQIR
jgi:hypothetical protein